EPEPLEILEDRALVLRAAPLPVVILDAQEHTAAARACDAPHVEGVDDVSQVEKAGRRRREPGYDGAHYEANSGGDSWRSRVLRGGERRRHRPGRHAPQARRVDNVRRGSLEYPLLSARSDYQGELRQARSRLAPEDRGLRSATRIQLPVDAADGR